QRIVRQLQRLPDVVQVTPMLLQRVDAFPWPAEAHGRTELMPQRWEDRVGAIDVHGIDLATEFTIREYPLVAGRMLTPDDDLALVLEAGLAERTQLRLGDYMLIWSESRAEPYEVEIVGLFERRRIARFQKPLALMRLPVLQRIRGKFAMITTADIVLADRNPETITRSVNRVRAIARRIASNATVRTAESRLKQIELAQRHQQF